MFKNPLVWVISALFVMLGIAVFLGNGGAKFAARSIQTTEKTDAAQQKRPTSQQLDTSVLGADPKKSASEYWPDCTKREDADLCAQRRMAKAAEEQTGLNEYGIWLLGGTLLATGLAAAFAKQAAKAARKTVAVMDRTARRQLRAYVNYAEGNVIDFNAATPMVQVKLKNYGQTPAYNVRTRILFWITRTPIAGEFQSLDNADVQHRGVLGPGAHCILGRTLGDPAPNADTRKAILEGRRGLFVFGDVVYDDAFGKGWHTTFRLVYGGGEEIRSDGSLATCEGGNEAT